MEILNTTGGGISAESIVYTVFFGLFAVVWVVLTFLAVAERRGGIAIICAIAAILTALIAFVGVSNREPIRHEVILHDGATIDATKYNVVEQRGKIYVIEERKVSG